MSEQIYRQAAEDFVKLPLDQKKSNLLELVNSFKDSHPIFKEIREDIQSFDYNDEQYTDIYKIVLKSMYDVERLGIDAGVERIEKLHNFLMQLRAKEAEENKKAGDIDQRLDKVLATLQ